MRTKKSLINMFVGFGGQGLSFIISFVNRIVFIHYLSAEYLGVNGLFGNVIGMLSLAELGIGSAIVFSLYKPLAENDRDQIGRLMNLYKQMYRRVAVAVAGIGMALFPFLDHLVKGQSVPHLRLIYLMYLANSVLSYLFSYKCSIFMADQRSYIKVVWEQAMHLIQMLIQILVLVLTRNFLLYLGIQMVCNLFVYIMIAWHADREYPYLKKYHELPEPQIREGITRNIKAMFMHKLGAIFVQGTDNLLVSAFVGLASVGIYSNYSMIMTNINSLLTRILEAFSASVGNLGATEKEGRIHEVYRTADFLMYLIYSYIAGGLLFLYNPFIRVFFGADYLFPMSIVWIIVANFYLNGMRQTNLIFREAMGLFWYDRYKSIAEGIVNLIVSVLLVRRFEVAGIFLGTIVSTLTTSFWVEPYVLMRYGMKKYWKRKLRDYFVRYVGRTAIAMAVILISIKICGKIPDGNIGWLIVNGCAYTACFGILMRILYRKSWERKDLLDRAKGFLAGRR